MNREIIEVSGFWLGPVGDQKIENFNASLGIQEAVVEVEIENRLQEVELNKPQRLLRECD